MMWFKILPLLISLHSCANVQKIDPTEWRGHSIERSFLPYVEEFEKQCKKKVAVHMHFTDIEKDPIIIKKSTVGYCLPEPYGVIHIDIDWWLKHANIHHREHLIFHELGHCVLGRYTHNNGLKENGDKASIMNEFMFYGSDYKDNKSEYIKELCP